MNKQTNKQPNTGPKKPNFLVRLVVFLLVLAVAMSLVILVAFRDSLNLDSVKRWFTYRSLARSDSGQADSFSYDGTLEDSFAVLDGDLLVCSRHTVSLYSGSGTRYINQSVSMTNPVVNTNGSLAVVYDAGGSSLYVLGQRTLIWSANDLSSILSARLNKNGQLTVVTQASGYRGAVTVYDAAYNPVMSVNLSSALAMDAALSDDGHTLAIVTIGQDTGTFTSSLALYSMDYSDGAYTPDSTQPLDNGVVLDLQHTNSAIWTLSDQGMAIAPRNGPITSLSWGGKYLWRSSLSGDDFAVALLSRYRAGNQSELWLVDEQGGNQTLTLTEPVLSISAAGRYVAVLTGDRLDIYTDKLEPYSTLNGTQGARNVLLMPDGSAILISAGSAAFYIP